MMSQEQGSMLLEMELLMQNEAKDMQGLVSSQADRMDGSRQRSMQQDMMDDQEKSHLWAHLLQNI